MQVSVDRDRCCSSGMCVTNVPEVFDQDDRDSLVRLRQTTFRPEQFADLRLAAELCPGGAITVTEDEPATVAD
ncbi:ferredoxin [Streptomyces sp. 1114.5]|uniref:ferredoxin n=1 Tax=unclassified Streptomyces TaxID=2593676 RepID=UPI000BD4D432|nr:MULTISPECIES: ferredoxin [unclassified Streptomyces]RKT19729.1 ferredoxin [Streptomyces sp. 1114.5]SOB85928.1 Ferredoxin [Streptomyces sp. 1331.2]